MRNALLIGSTLALLATMSLARGVERRPMTTDDDLEVVRLGSVLMSPDGRQVFFSTSELDWPKNRRKTSYLMIPSEGGTAIRYIGNAGGSAFQFSPDGKYLSLIRTARKTRQIFLIPTDGGEAFQLTHHRNSVNRYRWSANGEKIVFQADAPRSKEEKQRYRAGYDAVYIDEGPNGQVEGQWRHLWVFDMKTHKEVKVTSGNIIVGPFDVSPDGERIIYAARHENRRNQVDLSEIYLLDLRDGKQIRLTKNRVPEGRFQFAPDGKMFAYLATDDIDWERRLQKIWIWDLDSGKHRMVSGQFSGNIRNYFWSADARSILFSGQVGTNGNLYRINIGSGRLTQLTKVTGTLNVQAFSRDQTKMVYSFSDFQAPSDLYVSRTDRFEPVRLTDANPWLRTDILLAKGSVIRWKSRGGLEVEGLLFLPADYQEGSRIPLLLHIHGGPGALFSNRFYSFLHVWGGLGYASLCPNYRGSSGSGDEFLRANMYDLGGGEYWDLMSGVDYVIEQGYADPERMAVRGWSWGGVLGGWTITQTNRFKAASLGAMVTDWIAEYANGFSFNLVRWFIGGRFWDNPSGYRKASSLSFIKNVKTPTLVMHGARDRTVSEPQSMTFSTALRDQGVPTRYIRFPRESHGLREPRHQRIRAIEEIKWVQKYVLGVNWKPWEREDEIRPSPTKNESVGEPK